VSYYEQNLNAVSMGKKKCFQGQTQKYILI
jgi:hypothetical protein